VPHDLGARQVLQARGRLGEKGSHAMSEAENATAGTRGLSWNTHSLLTRAALGASTAPILGDEVTQVRLEDFLLAVEKEISSVIALYWASLENKGRPEKVRDVPLPGFAR